MNNQNWLSWCCQLSLVGAIALVTTKGALAQSNIVPDETLGVTESSVVTPLDASGISVDRIDGGAIRGSNLFHSFREFNVDVGRGAYFFSPNVNIQNILTRVTGRNPSEIFGTIGTFGASIPNLFLINPNGIIFEPNASLDMGNAGVNVGGTGGSFVATTANAVLLGENGIFSASEPARSNLLSVNPAAFFFNALSNPKPTIVNSSRATSTVLSTPTFGLQVPNGRSFLLVGGNVKFDSGAVFVQDGRVELGGVAAGTIGLNVNGNDVSLNFPRILERADVSLTNGAIASAGNIIIDAAQFRLDNGSLVRTVTQGAAKAGDIRIQARDTVTLANKGQILSESNSTATGSAGDINIAARNITIVGDGTTSRSTISTATNSQGNAGNLTLEATESINLRNGGIVAVSTTGVGNTGNLTVRAWESVNVTDNSYLALTTNSSGSTGNLRITTGTFNLSSPTVGVLSSGTGSAGSVFIQTRNAADIVNGQIYVQALGDSVGQAGDITLETQRLNIRGGQLVTNTGSRANAGNIVIRASESVDIRGVSLIAPQLTSTVSSATSGIRDNGDNFTESTGNGGNITIETPRLTLSQGGVVSTESIKSRGNAGNVTIRAKDIELDGYALVRDGFPQTQVSTGVILSETDVKGGTLTVDTERLQLSNGAILTTSVQSGRGQAGNLLVRASDFIDISGVGPRNRDGIPLSSGLFADVQRESIGSGGSINVGTGRLSLSNGGKISARTFARGNAGNVLINASQINLRGESTAILTQVNTEATGNAGDMDIDTQKLNLQDGANISSATFGSGNAGKLTIRANDIELIGAASGLSSSVEEGAGNGSPLNITTNRLTIRNGGFISSGTSGGGRAGNIYIDASDSVTIDGTQKGFSSSILARSRATATEGSGDITLKTNVLSVNQGGTIRATTANAFSGGSVIINGKTIDLTNGGQILTSASSSGQAGNITLNADRINLTGVDSTYTQRLAEFGRSIVTNEGQASGLYASTTEDSAGKGGAVRVNARQLNLLNLAQISARSLGAGTAGDVAITADEAVTLTNSDITTSAQQASGGAISLTAKTMRLYGDSDIRTNVENGINNGGNITLKANSIIAFDDSDILAFARDGRGGNVFLDTPAFFGENYQPAPGGTNPNTLDGNNRVDINATGAISSGIISTPDTSVIQNNLSELSQTPIDTNALIANSCIARNSKLEGSFTITGSDGLPYRPGDISISTYSTGDVRSVGGDRTSNLWRKGDPIVEPQGVYKLPSGQLVLSRECR